MNARMVFAAVLAGGLALTFAACGDDDDDSSRGRNDFGSMGESSGGQAEAPSTGSADTDRGGAGSDGGSPTLAQLDRKIIFTATMTLAAEDVGGAFNGATLLARTNGGYVESSSFSNAAEPERRTATLTIRVPVQNYDALLGSLRSMSGVTVESEGSNSTEVTEQYTDLSSRMRNLERTEEQYLALLDRATSINDILTVQDRLTDVRSQIEQIQGRLQVLDNMTDFATVAMTFTPVFAKAEEPKSGGGPQLAEVWERSWERSLEVARYVAAAGVVAVVAMAWLIVPLALVLIASRRFRRPATTSGPGDLNPG
jgi:hypothetical protein